MKPPANSTDDGIDLPPIRHTPAVSYAWRTRAISNDAASLLMQVVALAHKDGYCWMSNANLAWQSGVVSVPTIQRLLHQLIAGGWLRSELTSNDYGTLRKLWPNLEKIRAVPPKMVRPAHLLRDIRNDQTPQSGVSEQIRPGYQNRSDLGIRTDIQRRERKEEKKKTTKIVGNGVADMVGLSPSSTQKPRKAASPSKAQTTTPDHTTKPQSTSKVLMPIKTNNIPERKQKVKPRNDKSSAALQEETPTPESKPALKLRSNAKPALPLDARVTDDDIRFAEMLHQAILKAGRDLPRFSPNRPMKVTEWASHFRMLRENDYFETPRIEAVLLGFCQHITAEKAPQAWSGKSFRAKFAAIECFVKIKSADTPTEITDEESNDPDVIEIASWDWPVPILVPTLVKSVKIARSFGTCLRKVCRDLKGQDSYLDFLIQEILNHRSDAFTLLWHREALASIPDWKQWSGSMKMFEASPSSPLFRKWVLQLSKQGTNKHDVGKRFLREFEERMT